MLFDAFQPFDQGRFVDLEQTAGAARLASDVLHGQRFGRWRECFPEAQHSVDENVVGQAALGPALELVELAVARQGDKAQLDERTIQRILGDVPAALPGGDVSPQEAVDVALDRGPRRPASR